MTNPRELKSEDIARLIDVSTVRTAHGEADIRQLVSYAKEVSIYFRSRSALLGIVVE